MPKKSKKGSSKEEEGDENTRIAIVNADKCKPKKCKQECKKSCPVVRLGKMCIEVTPTSKMSSISEDLCIGCGICVKKCPFDAVHIINLPKALASQTTHRYGPNSFKLHRLPMPRPKEVLGLVGTNGIGKSTALKILAGKLKPNLGRFKAPPDWEEILRYFRGSELQNYFTKILEDDLTCVIKPQYVDQIPKVVRGETGALLKSKDSRGVREEMAEALDLTAVMEREVAALSGGELQRFAIAVVAVQEAGVYMFDEPSSYLDVKQRLKAARVIRDLCFQEDDEKTTYVVVVEHDLAVLDYLSDYICCLYGHQGAYGVVTMPFSVREGINIFLAGFVPTENMRFREEELSFKVVEHVEEEKDSSVRSTYEYPKLTKTLRSKKKKSKFKLKVKAGSFSNSQIIVMLGENGTGKTTFIRMLAGTLMPDPPKEKDEAAAAKAGGLEACTPPAKLGGFTVSYKPQKISPSSNDTVRVLLHKKIRDAFAHPQFQSDVAKPLMIEEIIDQEVKHLSGGELQRLAITVALGKPADVYLIDEPSAYLDSEQRIVAAKVIKRFILHAKKTAFVVEHDFIMATYLADRVIVYTGTPGVKAEAHAPQSLLSGMNEFLKMLHITFRRDPTNYRPRINKHDSVKDQEQKKAGTFFYMDD